ncbi:MAG: tetratricopeptide repeat protein [Rhizomicrobium sp.]
MRLGMIALCILALNAGAALASGYSELNLGITYHVRRQWDAVIVHLTAALRAPDLPAAYRSVAYLDRGDAYFQKGQLDKAIADYDACLAADPDYLQALIDRGVAYGRQGKFDPAIADFSALIARRPAHAFIYDARGVAYEGQKKFDLAIADFSTAIKLASSDPGAYMLRGFAYRVTGKDDAAIADYNAAIDINSDLAGAYIGRALANRDGGHYSEAARDLQTAMKLKPDSGEIRDLGVAQWEAGHYADAAQSFAQALQDNPADLYAVLWHLIATLNGQGHVGDDQRRSASARDLTKWPGPLVGVYIGSTQPDTALKAAQNSDPETQANQMCEANFYLGEWQVLAANKAAALPMLQAAQAQCPQVFIERDAATAQLKRLQ